MLAEGDRAELEDARAAAAADGETGTLEGAARAGEGVDVAIEESEGEEMGDGDGCGSSVGSIIKRTATPGSPPPAALLPLDAEPLEPVEPAPEVNEPGGAASTTIKAESPLDVQLSPTAAAARSNPSGAAAVAPSCTNTMTRRTNGIHGDAVADALPLEPAAGSAAGSGRSDCRTVNRSANLSPESLALAMSTRAVTSTSAAAESIGTRTVSESAGASWRDTDTTPTLEPAGPDGLLPTPLLLLLSGGRTIAPLGNGVAVPVSDVDADGGRELLADGAGTLRLALTLAEPLADGDMVPDDEADGDTLPLAVNDGDPVAVTVAADEPDGDTLDEPLTERLPLPVVLDDAETDADTDKLLLTLPEGAGLREALGLVEKDTDEDALHFSGCHHG